MYDFVLEWGEINDIVFFWPFEALILLCAIIEPSTLAPSTFLV